MNPWDAKDNFKLKTREFALSSRSYKLLMVQRGRLVIFVLDQPESKDFTTLILKVQGW